MHASRFYKIMPPSGFTLEKNVYFLYLSISAPNPGTEDARIPINELPQCALCGSLLRPHVIWFGESLDEAVLDRTYKEIDKCDLCLLVRLYPSLTLSYFLFLS